MIVCLEMYVCMYVCMKIISFFSGHIAELHVFITVYFVYVRRHAGTNNIPFDS